MKHTLEFPLHIEGPEAGNSGSVTVEMAVADPEWCVQLSMLRSGLLDMIRIRDGKTLIRLFPDARSGSGFFRFLGDEIEVHLTSNEVELAEDYFLKFFRDGAPAVPSIDIQLDAFDGDRKVAGITPYLTFLVARG